MRGSDSRWNYCVGIRVVGEGIGIAPGGDIENERLSLPYPREPVITVSRADVQEYEVRAGDTWSNVAARFYRGRSDLWWCIAEFTGVIDPFTEFFVGKKLKIPPFDLVQFEVLNFDAEERTGQIWERFLPQAK